MNRTLKDEITGIMHRSNETKADDNELIYQLLTERGFRIDREQFKKFPSFETITRCRRKIQEENPKMRAGKLKTYIRSEQAENIRRGINELN